MKRRWLIPLILWPFLTSPLPNYNPRINPKLTELTTESGVVYNKKVRNNFIYEYDERKREMPFCEKAIRSRGK